MMRLTFLICLFAFSCGRDKTGFDTISNEEINTIMAQLNESDPRFTAKDVSFDSIVTYAGFRMIDNKTEKLKLKLFFYNGVCRGYFNIPDKDNKNLQVFGSKVEGNWVLKCVTKLNMEEAGGYMIFDQKYIGSMNGIWSNGHVNFKKEKISLNRQEKDYNTITNW